MLRIVQGTESGGHGASPTGTFCFLPEVVDAVAGFAAQTGAPPVPVLAAGGVTDGRQVCVHRPPVICHLSTSVVGDHPVAWTVKQALTPRLPTLWQITSLNPVSADIPAGPRSFLRSEQVAAAFALGADGVVLGTRLVVTEESMFPAAWKVRE